MFAVLHPLIQLAIRMLLLNALPSENIEEKDFSIENAIVMHHIFVDINDELYEVCTEENLILMHSCTRVR